jgi:hypothetical protein
MIIELYRGMVSDTFGRLRGFGALKIIDKDSRLACTKKGVSLLILI